MTMITGIVTSYKNNRCIILVADRAVTLSSRKLEETKLKHIQPYPLVIGGAGDVSCLQKCERIIINFLKKYVDISQENICSQIDTLLFSKELSSELLNSLSKEDGEFLIGITDKKSSHLYHLLNNGNIVELNKFGCIGIGAQLGGIMALEFLYSPDNPPTLDEACRLGATLNAFISRTTKKVSPNFDIIALWNGKIGRLKKASKAKLIEHTNHITNTWFDLLEKAFFFLDKAIIDFLLETNLEKVKEAVEQKSKRELALIIDDRYKEQKSLYNIIQKILEKYKLNIIVCESRQEVKKIIKEKGSQIRIVFLDRRIHHKNTTDLAEEIYKEILGIPIILLSRGIKEKDIGEFLDKGVLFHISKEEIEKEPQKLEESLAGLLGEEDYIWEWT